MKKLSIIVPVYNMAGDGKLNFCLDSLLNQTIDHYEIIAVDDKSTDDSAKVLEEYQSRFPEKIKVILAPFNNRQGSAKNLGIRAAEGEWISFMDSDDWADPTMYEKLINRAEETGADVVGCDFCLVYDHTFEKTERIPNNRDDQVGVLDSAKRKSLILDGGSLCLKIYKRERILRDELFFPEGIFYEDNAIGNSYLVMANHFEYIKEPLYYYYQHSASTVHTITKARCKDRMTAGVKMIEEARKQGYFEEYKEELEYKFVILYYLNTLFSYMREGEDFDLRFIKSIGKGLIKEFPDFRNNKYYIERINEEEKKLTNLQLKNSFSFAIYYKLLTLYRKLLRH